MKLKTVTKTTIFLGGLAASFSLAGIAIAVINVAGIRFDTDEALATRSKPAHSQGVVVPGSSSDAVLPPAAPSGSATEPLAPSSRAAGLKSGAALRAQPKLSDDALLAKIRATPKGVWVTGGTPDQAAAMARSVVAGSLQTLIVYNLPNRDCGSYSAGGAGSETAYRAYIDGIATGIGGRAVRVVIEPDALGQCTTPARTAMVAYAAQTLQRAGGRVYIDASQWVEAKDMAGRLNDAGITAVTGFSLNVSAFQTTAVSAAYGRRISAMTGGKHFIIDTSRNGNGPFGEQWCNPPGRALGQMPTLATGSALIDGLLWLKAPGESDGACTEFGHADPIAGDWWPTYALGLGRAAGW